MNSLEKLYCASATPMNKNQEIDYEGFGSNIDWYIGQGLKGILVCGGTGEFVSLSRQERFKLAECAVEKINGRASCMICCADETTAGAVEFAKHAKAIGAESIMIIVSYYFKPSEEEIYQHYKNIAQSVDLPIVIYNNPGSSGTDLSPKQVKRICELDNIKYIKEASGDLRRIREILKLNDKINVYCGSDDIAFESFSNGATGWISITANALPGQSQEILDLFFAGELGKAKELFYKYLPLYSITEQPYKAIQIIKYCLDLLGCCGGSSRLPRLPLTEDEKRQIEGIMKAVGLL